MTRVADQADPRIREICAAGGQVAAIPVGSIEQHGPHLPVSTDTDIVTEVTRRLCDAGGYLMMPAVQYGVSYEHAPLFQASVSGQTLLRVLYDLAESLSRNGVETVFVVNGHHGNQRALSRLERKVRTGLGGDLQIFVLPYWRFIEERFDHAGPVETSLMLAISGNVDMSRAVRGLDADSLSRSDLRRVSRLAAKSFPAATGNGVWGDPTGATAEHGRALLEQAVANLHRECQSRIA